MKSKIIYIHRGDFHKRPPVISAVLNILSLGYELTLITNSINDLYRKLLESKGAKVCLAQYTPNSERSFISKLLVNLKYRFAVKKILKSYSPSEYDLWIEGNGTYVSLNSLFIKKYKLILQIQELYDGYLQKRATKKLIKSATVVFMPEYNRAVLYKVWFNLTDLPLVLPNKPYFTIDKERINYLKVKYANHIEQIGNKKIILYQGILTSERDLSNIIMEIDKLDEYRLVLLGQDYGMLDTYRKLSNKFIYLGYIPAPDYLFFTSLAYVGIVTYEPESLNAAYCAPNKIYEYSQFGVPMIGNNIPGLKYTIEYYNAGVLMTDDLHFIKALKVIEENYSFYTNSAKLFFTTTNNVAIIKKGLSI